jgi:ATP-dependent protease ClpP protease subunit
MTTNPTFYALEKSGDNETTVTLYDEIGAFGAGSKQFLGDIGKLSGQHIHLRINSPGGSVVEGTAIYNSLRRHKGGVTVHIDALAASMASVIAMAGAPVLIADNALMMIHNPWTVSMGGSEDLRKEADLLDMLKVNLRNAYVRKTGLGETEIQDMMDKETWLDAVDAVALGFADAIEEGVAAAATATPENLRARFDNFAKGMSQKAEIEVPEAGTVVSESIAAEPILEVESSEPTPTVEAEQPVAEEIIVDEPQAKANIADSILAKYNELSAKLDSALAESSAYKAKFDTVSQDLARLERSLGLSAARVVPIIENAAPEALDPVAEYLAAVESGDRKAASALFEKHKALIWQARQKISKA